MKKRSMMLAAALLAPALGLVAFLSQPAGAADPALSKAEADGIIFERQNLMLQLEKDAALLGDIVAGLKPADKLPEVTKSISESAASAKAAFETPVPGGRSKPEVWSNWPDYARRLEEFDKNAKQLAELGAKGDLTGVTGQLGSALQCKECHDVYRAPKKPA